MGICSSRSTYRQESFGNGNSESSFRRARGQVKNKSRDLRDYLPLYNAAVKGEWKEARNIFEQDPEALTAQITITSETALHLAVATCEEAINFVEKLVRKMTPENLALTDQQGDTALSVAAMVGNIPAAKTLVNKNPLLPNISGKSGFPIHKAARFGHKNMVVYLLGVTKSDIEPNPFVGEAGGHLLIDVIAADFCDIALELVSRYPETATAEINGIGSPLTVLTRKSTVFSSGHVATLWSSLLYSDTSFFRKAKERKLKERQARQLLQTLCREVLELDDAKISSVLQQPLHTAAMLGIPEIIEAIVDAYPPAIWFTDKDNYNIFQLAVLNRREEVFNLIYQMTLIKYMITSCFDSQGNNMLHLVGRLPPSDRLNLVSGPAFQVQREMQWVKEVAKLVQPAQRVAKNKEGKTPEMVFTEEHQQLMKDGVTWIKQITTSSTVFVTLVATVAFAGGMHVPEGSTVAFARGLHVSEGDTKGTTVVHYKKAFKIFVVADTISLILSVISIITFLSIIISRYSEAHFLSLFPQQLYFGLSILFISINNVLIAFGVALYLLLSPYIPLLEYGFVALIGLSFLPILYPILWFINERGRFGKKGRRQLR